MEAKAEREARECGTGFEERGKGPLVGEGGVAEHRDEVVEGEEGVGVGGDDGGP